MYLTRQRYIRNQLCTFLHTPCLCMKVTRKQENTHVHGIHVATLTDHVTTPVGRNSIAALQIEG